MKNGNRIKGKLCVLFDFSKKIYTHKQNRYSHMQKYSRQARACAVKYVSTSIVEICINFINKYMVT